jgi:DNA-binding GntR family transcriptional regulator
MVYQMGKETETDMDTVFETPEPKLASGASRLAVKPIDTTASFRMQAYHSLKRAILEMDVYDHPGEIRLDERQLSQDLGVSRTPIREAMSLLEQEGFVKTLPRRGVFVVRKSKREIVEMILVWAALETMAARLVCQNATDKEIASLRRLFDDFREGPEADHLQEYSEANIAFHSAIIRLSKCQLIADLTKNLFIHMRAIRKVTISEDNRAQRSIQDHMAIIEALEARDVERAENLVRKHSLDLAAHVEKHCHHLD